MGGEGGEEGGEEGKRGKWSDNYDWIEPGASLGGLASQAKLTTSGGPVLVTLAFIRSRTASTSTPCMLPHSPSPLCSVLGPTPALLAAF